jgi:quercetin dioxygenase-like cupin family protein
MKRRSFLKSASALFPMAGLEAFALGQTTAASRAGDQAHPVSSGEDRFGEKHSLGFSTILFKVAPSETGGNLFVIEHQHLVKGGPPLHLHPHQEEYFYVMEGEVVFQLGDSRRRLGAGDSVLGPRGVPHTFSPVGTQPGRMLIAFTPAGKMEEFFRATAVPNGPVLDAELFRRYDMEYLGPPLVTG